MKKANTVLIPCTLIMNDDELGQAKRRATMSSLECLSLRILQQFAGWDTARAPIQLDDMVSYMVASCFQAFKACIIAVLLLPKPLQLNAETSQTVLRPEVTP